MSNAESKTDGSLIWFTSPYSNGAGGECVECAFTSDGALVRDSKSAEGPVVVVQGHVWQSFIRHLKNQQP
ncbi:DUF397 domain-containing protein [Streptomyces sp. NBC_00564]|uniref:DUF397 domain-containing protein n=1 Tax=unclassified Streptomyces TaxID=2593676 RepID=UPI00324C2A8C|nr:DUF397 domain-containing protein [Streptomyces sp. NBC_00564]